MTEYLQITDDAELERTLGAINHGYLAQRAAEEGVTEGESFERYAGIDPAVARPPQVTTGYTEAIRDPDGVTPGGLIEVDDVVAVLHGTEAKVPIANAAPIDAATAQVDYTVTAKPDGTVELTRKGTGAKTEAMLVADKLIAIERVTVDVSAKVSRGKLAAEYEAVLAKREAAASARDAGAVGAQPKGGAAKPKT